ncbi:MAG: acyltransferase family protein [Eubacteriales bacterium]|nr:acyltransferase family protein [Eubacteriales bacterium]
MDKRDYRLDVIRIMACCFVVLIHVATYGMEIMDPAGSDWMIRNIVSCAARSAVPVFFMISGILFMEKTVSLKSLYGKYIARIFASWALWSAFYALIDYAASRKDGNASLGYFAERFLKGHYHLWFLPTLIVVYMLLPMIQRVVVGCPGFLMKYFGALVLIGVIGRETLAPYVHNAGWDGLWDNFSIPLVSVGVIYFVLGYCLYQKKNWISAKAGFAMYVLAAATMAAVNGIHAVWAGGHRSSASVYLGLGVLLTSAGLFTCLLQTIPEKGFSDRQKKILREVSDCTFGIYLMHTFFIEQVYRRVGLTQEMFPTLVSIVFFFALTFGISLAGAWCLRRIPVIRRWAL